jgi:hypothetical protein
MLLVVALIGVMVTWCAAGCGGGDATETRPLTKKRFVALTEAFCSREYKAEERDMEKFAAEHGLLYGRAEPWEQEVLVEEVIFDYVRDKIAYFESLPAPEGDEEEVGEMIESFEEGLERSEAAPATLAGARPGQKPLPDPFARSYETTSDYGPWLCGQS